jgi:putative membrane protein
MKTINLHPRFPFHPARRPVRTRIALSALCLIGGLAGIPALHAQADPAPVRRADSDPAGSTLARKDRVFLDKAHAAGQEELAMAKMALNSANTQVQEFARQLIADHEKIGQELEALARSRGVSWERTPDKSAEKLSTKTGADLDKAFVEKAREAHNDAVDLFEEEAKDGKDPEVRAFAARHVETMRAHREKARQLKTLVD